MDQKFQKEIPHENFVSMPFFWGGGGALPDLCLHEGSHKFCLRLFEHRTQENMQAEHLLNNDLCSCCVKETLVIVPGNFVLP